ncbi:hypothetical protein LXL04_026226 [Taraxacum kok-saghyz]
MPANELNFSGMVDCRFVTSLRIKRSCGNVVRLILDSEAMVTSEEIKSSEAMRILRRLDIFRSDEFLRRRSILKQRRHTKGQTFHGRNEIRSMTSEVRMVSEHDRNHHLQVETKPACLLRIRACNVVDEVVKVHARLRKKHHDRADALNIWEFSSFGAYCFLGHFYPSFWGLLLLMLGLVDVAAFLDFFALWFVAATFFDPFSLLLGAVCLGEGLGCGFAVLQLSSDLVVSSFVLCASSVTPPNLSAETSEGGDFMYKEGELFCSFFHLLHLRYREPYNRASMTSDARHARLRWSLASDARHVRFSRRRDSGSGWSRPRVTKRKERDRVHQQLTPTHLMLLQPLLDEPPCLNLDQKPWKKPTAASDHRWKNGGLIQGCEIQQALASNQRFFWSIRFSGPCNSSGVLTIYCGAVVDRDSLGSLLDHLWTWGSYGLYTIVYTL